ncbi:nucleotidyltransferase domain-containing protein [Candidatus Poribacteria bacterium]|nr:nucleotidyltransferase domain-containing protein [Candidatus Poribacteria bacterium]
MQHPKENTYPTKDPSVEVDTLSSYHLDERLKYHKVDKELLQRAWHTAYRIAAKLYEDFDATQVAVFGSLAEGYNFSKWSDIDIVVWGISNDRYLRALSVASDISRLFKVDLVMFENCGEEFQERIRKKLRYIEKGVIFEVNRTGLIERIGTERDNLKKL